MISSGGARDAASRAWPKTSWLCQPPCWQPARLIPDGRLDRWIERELQDGSEPNRAQHPERVFVEGRLRLERCHDPARFQIGDAASGQVEHSAVPVHQQRVDREVPSHDVIFQRPGTDIGLSAVPVVSLDAAGHELQGVVVEVEVRRPESLEDDGWMQLQGGAHRGRQLDRALALHQDVDFANLARPFPTQQAVPHVSPNDQGAQPALPGLLLDGGKSRPPFRERRRIKPSGHAGLEAARTRPRRSVPHHHPAPEGQYAGHGARPSRTRRSSTAASAGAVGRRP